jgi:hypothetical protein
MGFLSNFFDRFKATDFHIAPNKKIKSIQAEFKNNFGLTLRVYKGKALADPEMTFAQLNQRTSKDVKASNSDLIIKANMNIGDFEKLIDQHFGVTVQIANEFDTYCVNNKYTIGQASRKEDIDEWCKSKGFDSLEDWLKSENCETLAEWYEKNGK